MRYEKTFPASRPPPPGEAAPRLVMWSSLEEYELEGYLEALGRAFPHVIFALSRMPTGELAARLGRRDFGERPPQLVFGTAATALAEPALSAMLAPAVGGQPGARWVAASGFRNAVLSHPAALGRHGLYAPKSWAMLADPRYRGLIAFPDPQASGAGALALATMVQGIGEEDGWRVIAGIKRNLGATFSSSLACARAALDPATPIAVSVEIACLQVLADHPELEVAVPRDASAVELEAFAMLAGDGIGNGNGNGIGIGIGNGIGTGNGTGTGPGNGDAELCRQILAWAVGEESRAVARRWRKVTMDPRAAPRPRGEPITLGSVVLDHERAVRERADAIARFAALPGARIDGGAAAGSAPPRVAAPIGDTYRHGLGRDADCLRAALAGSITGASRPVEAYEVATAAQFGAAHAIAVSSGSAAVLAALAGLGLPRGGKVILSPLAPLCTVYPIMALGLEPVFCDTNPDDFGLCLDDLQALLSPEVAAVVEVPMWGYPVPSDGVQRLCERRGTPLVMDLAHGHRIRLHGRDLWTYGQVATFSTHEGKILSTGEGGMVLTGDAALAAAVRGYTRFGNLDGATFGINLKMSGLQAALGERRMLAFARDLDERRRKARLFFDHLATPLVRPWPVCPGGEPNYYAILVEIGGESPAANRRIIEALGAAGIPSDQLKYPCQTLYRFEQLASYARPCRNAEALIARLSTVPVHPDLDDAALIDMAETANRVAARLLASPSAGGATPSPPS